MLTVFALFALAAWVYLAFGHGRFWTASERLRPAPYPEKWPDVVAVIPARDEAAGVYQVVRAHMMTDYPGRFDLILVDDGSTDGTAALAREAAREGPRDFHLVTAEPIEPGWTGKLWALAQGLKRAGEISPNAEYVLLTDADIVHAPGTLRRLVSKAEREDLAQASLMAKLDARGFWGGLLMPAFVYFFQMLYPFPWANDPNRYLAAAAGGCILARRSVLDGVDAIATVRGRLIDDCALAEVMKGAPPVRRIWIGLADREVFSLRDNRSLSSVWHMVARTAFAQLGYSAVLLAGTVISLLVVYAAPVAAVLFWPLHGETGAGIMGLAAWGLMALTYRPTARLYGVPLIALPALPAAAIVYAAMTVSSAIRHWRGQGGQWKGRTYTD